VSNHESKAAGVLAAIVLVKESCVGNAMKRVIILVDNQGVIRRTIDPGAPKPGQWFFKEIDKALADIPSCLKVSFVWCPGHRDILGNELADKLAKQALESSSGPTLRAKGNFKKVQRTALADLMASDKPWTPSVLHISSILLINQLASGHCALKNHLFQICRTLEPLCPFCGAREKVFHFMNFCPQAKARRLALRRNLRRLKIWFKAKRLDLVLKNQRAEEAISGFLCNTNKFPNKQNLFVVASTVFSVLFSLVFLSNFITPEISHITRAGCGYPLSAGGGL
jgi:ribonuclease HI